MEEDDGSCLLHPTPFLLLCLSLTILWVGSQNTRGSTSLFWIRLFIDGRRASCVGEKLFLLEESNSVSTVDLQDLAWRSNIVSCVLNSWIDILFLVYTKMVDSRVGDAYSILLYSDSDCLWVFFKLFEKDFLKGQLLILVYIYFFNSPTDMHLFGHYPAHDDFYLVVCNICNQVVKPQVFQSHCGKWKLLFLDYGLVYMSIRNGALGVTFF